MTAPKLIPVRKIRVGKLFVDTSYQRVPDMRRVMRIVANFDAHAFQVLEVSARENGRFAVFDGGHKFKAAGILGFDSLYCRVHSGLTQSDEAMYFNMLQTERKPLSQIDMFGADLVRGYEPALRVQGIVDQEGFRIGARVDNASLTFIKALYRADSLGVLAAQLRAIREAWGVKTGESAVTSQRFSKLTSLIAAIPEPIDRTALISTMGKNQYNIGTYYTTKGLMNDYLQQQQILERRISGRAA